MNYIILIASICFSPTDCIDVNVYEWEVKPQEVEQSLRDCRNQVVHLANFFNIKARCLVWGE